MEFNVMNTNKYNIEEYEPAVRHKLRRGYISTQEISNTWETLIVKEGCEFTHGVVREYKDYKEALFYHRVYYDLYSSIEKLDKASDLESMREAVGNIRSALGMLKESNLNGGD